MNEPEKITQEDIISAVGDTLFFANRILGYDKINEDHLQWIRWFTEHGDGTLQAHRNSYKTTCLVIASVLRLFLYPDTRILIIRKSFADAAAIVEEVRTHFESSVMRELCKIVYGMDPKNPRKWRTDKFSLSMKRKVTKEYNIESAGVGKAVTGQHYDLILADDIVTIQDRVSKNEREKTKMFIKETVNLLNNDGIGRKFTGTPWHENDAFTILPEPIKFPLGSIRIPELTPEKIKNLRQILGESLFSANYMLEHISSEDRLFNEILFEDYIIDENTHSIAWIDPAYGGGNSCSLTIGSQRDGILYARGWNSKKSIVEFCGNWMTEIFTQYKVGTVWYEGNGDKGLGADHVRKHWPQVKVHTETKNKFLRIMNYLKPIWATVRIDPKTNEDYIRQLSEYNEFAEDDDAPDSLAGISQVLNGKISEPRIRSI